MSVEKPNLTSLRFLLASFFAGLGCILPYLSLHIRKTGLGVAEARLISIVAPLVATLGPSVAGPLVDLLSGRSRVSKVEARPENNRSVRTVLAISILLSTVFYCLLLAVPSVQQLPTRHPSVTFVCNGNGASLVQEKCNAECKLPGEKHGELVLSRCHFDCSYPAHYGYLEDGDEGADTTTLPTTTTTTVTLAPAPPSIGEIENLDHFFGPAKVEDDDDDLDIGSGEEPDFNWNKQSRRRRDEEESVEEEEEENIPSEPPHICQNSKRSSTPAMCMVYTPNTQVLRTNATLHRVRPDSLFCTYPLGEYFCRVPGASSPACKVVCALKEPYAQESVLVETQCENTVGDVQFTFWMYLTIRSLGDLFTAASITLLLSATLVVARDDIGRELVLPTFTYGLCSVLVGYLYSETLSPLKLEHVANFSLAILGFGVFTILAVLLLTFASEMAVGPPDWWWSTRSVQVRHKGELSAVLLVLVLLGALWGPFYFHVPLHIGDQKGLELFVGCSTAIGAFLSGPFVWKAETIITYCGYSNILITAFTFYILRYTGLLFISNPWVLLITGALEVFTLCLMIFSAIFYVRHLVPKHLTFTAQAWAFAAHFCLGNGLGCLASTLLSPPAAGFDPAINNTTRTEQETQIQAGASAYHVLYVVGAVAAAGVAVIYFIIYHCFLKKRCMAPAYRKEAANSNLVQGSTGNGTYTPLRIYHNGRQHRDAANSN